MESTKAVLFRMPFIRSVMLFSVFFCLLFCVFLFFTSIVISRRLLVSTLREYDLLHRAWFRIHCQLKTEKTYSLRTQPHRCLSISFHSSSAVAAFSVNIRYSFAHRSTLTLIHATYGLLLFQSWRTRSRSRTHNHLNALKLFLMGGFHSGFCTRASYNWCVFEMKKEYWIIVWLNPTHLCHLLERPVHVWHSAFSVTSHDYRRSRYNLHALSSKLAFVYFSLYIFRSIFLSLLEWQINTCCDAYVWCSVTRSGKVHWNGFLNWKSTSNPSHDADRFLAKRDVRASKFIALENDIFSQCITISVCGRSRKRHWWNQKPNAKTWYPHPHTHTSLYVKNNISIGVHRPVYYQLGKSVHCATSDHYEFRAQCALEQVLVVVFFFETKLQNYV